MAERHYEGNLLNKETIQWRCQKLSTTPLISTELMSPNKGETAVHGCHYPGDMVVRMRTVLAIPRGWCVCLSADKCC